MLLGGTLYQDLLEQKGWIHSNGKIRHDLYAEEGSILHALFGPVFKVNSTHHQAIKALAPGLRVTARSVEGIIEGYEHESLPIFGVRSIRSGSLACNGTAARPILSPSLSVSSRWCGQKAPVGRERHEMDDRF